MPIETFNISFESTENKQQYDTNITFTEERGKVVVISNVLKTFSSLDPSPSNPPPLKGGLDLKPKKL